MTRQEAIEWFKLMQEKFENTKYADALNMAIEALQQQRQEILPKHCIVPPSDAVGVPKSGKWVDVSERGSWSIKNACDQCGEIVFQPNYNYCPNCGARMESE